MPAPSSPTAVYLEVGAKRVFACAYDWPGWCRTAKTEELALDALAEYAPRYAAVPAQAGVRFPKHAGATFDVVERVPGNATTDFGAPDKVTARDHAPMTGARAKRMAALVEASWFVLDRVVAGAPAALRRGPRGGGRDRDAVAQHVLNAEASYARKLGIRRRGPVLGDATGVSALRAATLAVLRRPYDGVLPVEKGWPPSYAARRIAWHALDHAWEIEDKSGPAPT